MSTYCQVNHTRWSLTRQTCFCKFVRIFIYIYRGKGIVEERYMQYDSKFKFRNSHFLKVTYLDLDVRSPFVVIPEYGTLQRHV